jgi:hypothetical protein
VGVEGGNLESTGERWSQRSRVGRVPLFWLVVWTLLQPILDDG